MDPGMEAADRHSEHSRGPILPMAHSTHGAREAAQKKIAFMSHTQRTHLIAMIGEFVGTTLFLWFGFSGAQVANTVTPAGTTDASQIFYLALIFGFSLMVNVWIFYRISGGVFNPAVSVQPLVYLIGKLTHHHPR